MIGQGSHHREKFFRGHRPREQKSLQINRREIRKQGQLLAALDAFSRHFQPEVVAETDESPGDRRRTGAGMNARDQRAIELHARQRQLLERGQRGVADAKIIQRDGDAVAAQLPQHFDGRRAGLQHVFGELDLDAARRQADVRAAAPSRGRQTAHRAAGAKTD